MGSGVMLAWEVEGLGNRSSFSAGFDWLSWLLLWFILGFSDSASISVSGVESSCSLSSLVRWIDEWSSLSKWSMSE